ncbi:13384_t:CDS:2, partial [Cetraspora pellucida]
MFCTWCQEINAKNIFVQGGYEWLKEESLTRHIKICDHINAAKGKDIRQQNLFSSFTIQYGEIKAKALENYATYQNPVAGREMLESLAYIVEKDTISEINSSLFWSILLDESNTITNEKTLAIVSKHFANNIPVICYIGMISLNETTAEAILADLELFCTAKGLDLTRLIHFGSDGASNMIELHNGLGARLKCKNPFISANHCISYHLHLAAEDASKGLQYFSDYTAVVKGIYSYWSASYKQKNSLRIVQDENIHHEFLSVLNIVDTRWLSWANVINNLYQILDDIKEAFNRDSTTTALYFYDAMDQDFFLVTYFLADLFYILHKVINIFQSNYVSLGEIKAQLSMAIESITTEFIGSPGNLPQLGTQLLNYMTTNRISTPELPLFVAQYATNIITSLRNRFPDSNLYHALRIVDPHEIPTKRQALNNFGKDEIIFLGNYYDKEIENEYEKTGILSLLSDTEIDNYTYAIQDLKDVEKDEVDELIIDLTTNLSDPTIECQLNEFNNINDSQILTKDLLNEEEIKFEEGDANDTDEKLPEIPITEGLNELTKFISLFEQQE